MRVSIGVQSDNDYVKAKTQKLNKIDMLDSDFFSQNSSVKTAKTAGSIYRRKRRCSGCETN